MASSSVGQSGIAAPGHCLYLQTHLALLCDLLETTKSLLNALPVSTSHSGPVKPLTDIQRRFLLPVTVNPKEHKEKNLAFLQMLAYPSCPWLKTLNTHQVKGSGST